jgi:hypothetical protein
MTYYSSHRCSRIPNGPQYVGLLLHGMQTAPLEEPHCFIDRIGQIVKIPQRETGNGRTTPYADDGYAKALWDYRNDSLLLGDDNKTLFVRDTDQTGENALLDTWHAISNLENEYHVKTKNAYYPWNEQLRVECAKLPVRVKHGIKFANRAYLRTGNGITTLTNTDPAFQQPFELTIGMPYDPQISQQAVAYLEDITVDIHSAQNLARLFPTPLLEPYKHLTYILYGDGGNGKGIILGSLRKSFPRLTASIDSQRVLGGKRGNGGFETQQETGKLIGALWAYDEDADAIGIDQLTYLKKISTGDEVAARRIGENAVSFSPKCTFIIATNNDVITTLNAAISRRFAQVRMKDNRKPAEFQPLLEFIDQYGAAPFLMAGCIVWKKYGDDPFTDVSIGNPNDITDLEQAVIDSICAKGYALSSLIEPLRRSEQRDIISKLGLQRGGRKWLKDEGAVQRIITLKDETRFAPYRNAYERDREQLESQLQTVTPVPEPIEADPLPLPTEFGFRADYTPAGADKVARNWKRLTEDPAYDSTIRPSTDAYAVVPSLGMAVIDMDKPHADPPDQTDGWTTLNTQVGDYGTSQFPATYLVGTPSGGVHAYYLLPGRLIGRLKNSVHNNGIPIDIRCERKGYVIGPGSHTMKGEYRLLDMPQDGVPIMSDQLADWLETNGYVEGITPQSHHAPLSARVTRTGSLPSVDDIMRDMTPNLDGTGHPEMGAIPEGQRNSTLFNWLLGRRINHPENETNIRNEFYERGRISGLGDQELTTIWNSVTTIINQKH